MTTAYKIATFNPNHVDNGRTYDSFEQALADVEASYGTKGAKLIIWSDGLTAEEKAEGFTSVDRVSAEGDPEDADYGSIYEFEVEE